jgi:hypothetical protein
MSKPISNAAFKRMIEDLPIDQQIESIKRGIRILTATMNSEAFEKSPGMQKFIPKRLNFLEKLLLSKVI